MYINGSKDKRQTQRFSITKKCVGTFASAENVPGITYTTSIKYIYSRTSFKRT